MLLHFILLVGLLCCCFIAAHLCDVHLCSFGLKLQLYCHELEWPRRLHRKAGAGANGAHQLPDVKNPQLYHVYITFSLEICDRLVSGVIIPGLVVQTNKFCAAYPSFHPLKTRIVSPSQDEDDEHEEEDDDDDCFDEADDDSMDSPAAGSSTSPAICATPTSVGKRPMSPKQAASVKRPCVQAKLSSCRVNSNVIVTKP